MLNDFLTRFLKEQFPELPLRPPLFYSWKYALRFEIADPAETYHSKKNLKQMELRINSLFDQVFQPTDRILLVTDVHTDRRSTYLQERPLNVYRKYVKSKSSLYRLQHAVLPGMFDEDENSITHRFVLPCRKTDIRYPQLLRAISFEDFGRPFTTILKGDMRSGYDCYFINVTKGLIFHLYDDRGCDIIAADKKELQVIYDSYKDWLLAYDRKKIDCLFSPLF